MCNLFLQFTGINFYAHEKAVKSTHNFKHKRLEKRCNHALSEPFALIQLSKMGFLLHFQWKNKVIEAKRPPPAHSTQASGLLIFPYFFNYCKPRSFYFSMLRLRLTLFPLLFNCCKPCSFFIFLRCICRPALSLIVCLYKSSSSAAAAALQAIFLFFL